MGIHIDFWDDFAARSTVYAHNVKSYKSKLA